jgi:ferredoxin-type protein NapG
MDRKSFFKQLMVKGLELIGDNPLVHALENCAIVKTHPPGALIGVEFQTACTGCDACMVACPVNVIMVEDLKRRLPVIYPETAPCLHCTGYPCIQACPTGALSMANLTG